MSCLVFLLNIPSVIFTGSRVSLPFLSQKVSSIKKSRGSNISSFFLHKCLKALLYQLPVYSWSITSYDSKGAFVGSDLSGNSNFSSVINSISVKNDQITSINEYFTTFTILLLNIVIGLIIGLRLDR